MRTGRNLTVAIGGSFWNAAINIAAVPVYLHYLGVEAYGLVGFFAAMQAVFQSLDLGLAPTINREVARGQSIGDLSEARALLAGLAIFYWSIGAMIAIGVAVAAPWLARSWLTSRGLPVETITTAVALMGLGAGLRFPVGLYLNALQGAHRIAEAALINAGLSTLGVIGAILIFAFGHATVEVFFLWQVAIAALLLLSSRYAAWSQIGAVANGQSRTGAIRRVWRFTAGMSIVAALGMVLTQLDKLVVSHAVTLAAFGTYTLAGLAARTLGLFVMPVFSVVYPRMSAFVAAGKEREVEELYQSGTRLLMSILMPVTVYIMVFVVDLFEIWTGNPQLAGIVRVPAMLLLLGSSLNAVMMFPYALQLAYGQARLPAIITLVLVLGFVPLLLWLVPIWGIAGAAAAWAVLNLAYVPLGAILTHRSILRERGVRWLVGGIIVPSMLALLIVGPISYALHESNLPIVVRLVLGTVSLPLAFGVIVGTSRPLRLGFSNSLARYFKAREFNRAL